MAPATARCCWCLPPSLIIAPVDQPDTGPVLAARRLPCLARCRLVPRTSRHRMTRELPSTNHMPVSPRRRHRSSFSSMTIPALSPSCFRRSLAVVIPSVGTACCISFQPADRACLFASEEISPLSRPFLSQFFAAFFVLVLCTLVLVASQRSFHCSCGLCRTRFYAAISSIEASV